MTFQPRNERISLVNTEAVLSQINKNEFLLGLTEAQYNRLCYLLRENIEGAKSARANSTDEDEHDNLTYNIDIEEVILIKLRGLKPPVEPNEYWDDLPF